MLNSTPPSESYDLSANADYLLKTRNLTRVAIEQKIANFESLLADGYKPSAELFQKYQKLKIKLSSAINGVFSISEKYFREKDYKAIASKINLSKDHSQTPKVIKLKLSLRVTPNRDRLILQVKAKTNIQLLSSNSYRVSYLGDGNEVIFDLSFENNKARISMISSYFKNYPNAKTDGDLFPEEIQIAMFKKLLENHPEVLPELKKAKKVVVYQKNIANQLSKKIIKKYLELRAGNYQQITSENADSQNLGFLNAILSSNPNQQNTMNFIVALNEHLGMNLKANSSAKFFLSYGNISLKQSFENNFEEHQDFPLHLAIKKSDQITIDRILETASVDELSKEDKYASTPIHFACQYGNLDLLKKLTTRLVDMQSDNIYGERPIHLACEGGNYEIVRFLIEQQVNLNVVDNISQTPLHIAVKSGNSRLCELLLSVEEVKIDFFDYKNKTVFDYALDLFSKDTGSPILKLILEKKSAHLSPQNFEQIFSKIIANQEQKYHKNIAEIINLSLASPNCPQQVKEQIERIKDFNLSGLNTLSKPTTPNRPLLGKIIELKSNDCCIIS